MKIGIDIRLIGKNQTGSEAYFFNLVKNLAKVDQKNEYFLYIDRNPERDEELSRTIEELNLGENFKIIFIDSRNRFCWNLRALPAYLKKNPVYIFHTQYIAPFWLPKNIKLVLTIHDISFNYFPQHIRKSDLFFLKMLIPKSIKRADKIITVSESEKKNIVDYYKVSAEKVAVTYNGVDLEKFSREFSLKEKEKVRKKYNLPEKFLLYMGTLQPRKNIPVIIKAMNDLNIELVLAGNRNAHNFDENIDRAIEENGLASKIIFPGWIDEDDKTAIYQYQKKVDNLVANFSLKNLIEKNRDQFFNGKPQTVKKLTPSFFKKQDFSNRLTYLKGDHNLENAAAAIKVSEILKINKEKAIKKVKEKYPAHLFKNRPKHIDAGSEEIYWKIKKEHRMKGE